MNINKLKRSIIFFILQFSIIFTQVNNNEKTLRFKKDGTFKILQFTDLHYGELPLEKDLNSSNIQKLILQWEHPDLVVLTGDMVSGYAWNRSKIEPWFIKRFNQLIEPMMELGYRWAYALGNHDDQADLTRREIISYDMTFPLSLTKHGPKNIHGVTNYYLPIYSNQSNDVMVNIWIFDSQDNNCLNVTGWGCIYPDQVEWYRKTSNKIQQTNNGRIIPGLAFFHIPLPEYINMWNDETTFGRLEDEGICCFSVNTGLYAAMLENKNIQVVSCG